MVAPAPWQQASTAEATDAADGANVADDDADVADDVDGAERSVTRLILRGKRPGEAEGNSETDADANANDADEAEQEQDAKVANKAKKEAAAMHKQEVLEEDKANLCQGCNGDYRSDAAKRYVAAGLSICPSGYAPCALVLYIL